MKFAIWFLVCMLASLYSTYSGNRLGDQATLKGCATKGEATMVGGGTIKCEVVRETK